MRPRTWNWGNGLQTYPPIWVIPKYGKWVRNAGAPTQYAGFCWYEACS